MKNFRFVSYCSAILIALIGKRCKLTLSLFLIFFTGAIFLFPKAGTSQSADSILSLTVSTQRLLMVEQRVIELIMKNQPIKEFADAVITRGSKSEKSFISLWLERMKLNEPCSDKAIALVNFYITKAKALNDNALLGIYYSTVADMHLLRHNYNLAFENFLYCYDALKNDPQKKFYRQSWFLYNIAFQYYLFKDYDRAIEIGKAASKLMPKPWHGRWFVSVTSDLVAMAHLKKGQHDSALVWLKKTYDNAVSIKDTAWLGIVSGNRGQIYLLQNQLTESAQHLETGISLCSSKQIWDNVATFSVALADLRLRQANITLAANALSVAEAANRRQPNGETSFNLFTIKARYLRQTQNLVAALQAMDSANLYGQKLQDTFNANRKVLTESNLVFEKNALELRIVRQRAKQKEWILYGLLALLIALAAVAIMFYKRQKLQHMLKQERLEMETLKAEEEVHIAKMQLEEFSRHAAQQSRLLENFIVEVERLKKQNSLVATDQHEIIEQLKRSTILTDEDWNIFKNSFEKVYPGFLNELKNTYPDLTPAETRYVVFVKLKMAPKEMAAMLGISAEGLRNIRFRLRKKIITPGQEDIESIVNRI